MTMVRWLEELSRADIAEVGGKGAHLGDMVQAGLPVPPGFVAGVEAYHALVRAAGLGDEMAALLTGINVDDPQQLRNAAESLQRLVRHAPIPEDVQRAIRDAYQDLSRRTGQERPPVAVRSSATVEDTAQFSFAGMFQSFLNVRGSEDLLNRIRDCWASAFGARILFYRAKQGMTGETPIAVVVQQMVNAEKSGVLFSVDPARNDPDTMVIEAAWGLGEVVVGGQVTPDRYEVNKERLSLERRSVARKAFMLTYNEHTGQNVRVDLAEEQAVAPVLSEHEVYVLADLGRRAEAAFGAAQDLEWAIAEGKTWLVQTRPVTTLLERLGTPTSAPRGRILLHGLGASPGAATGQVRVLRTPDEAAALQPGEILVTTMTTPDWVPVMRRAAALITDAGGMTSHAAIVSRELGIPCIVGARQATTVLHDGMTITVNAREGTVLTGVPLEVQQPSPGAASPASAPGTPLVTGTRLYVNLAVPELAERVARQPVDGVGLLRAEFMLLHALGGIHPRQLLQQGQGDEFVAKMADHLRIFGSAFAPRPVIYRAMDFRTNEFRRLKGGDQFEPQEDNPMIGYRGCFRYVREPGLFALELQALRQARADYANLHLMIPFVRTAWEFRECARLIAQSGLLDDRRLQLWVMAEVPSVLWHLEEYVRLGATGVSIGSNDLTQLLLGVDRDGENVAPLFDERDSAVLAAVRSIIQECQRLGITSSICGQAPSVYPDYVEHLVRWGIDSVSVNPDVVDVTRRNLAAAEQRLLLTQVRSQHLGLFRR